MRFASPPKRVSRLVDSHFYEKGHLFLERKRNSNIAETGWSLIIDMQIGLFPEAVQVITLICNEGPCFSFCEFISLHVLFARGSFFRTSAAWDPSEGHDGRSSLLRFSRIVLCDANFEKYVTYTYTLMHVRMHTHHHHHITTPHAPLTHTPHPAPHYASPTHQHEYWPCTNLHMYQVHVVFKIFQKIKMADNFDQSKPTVIWSSQAEVRLVDLVFVLSIQTCSREWLIIMSMAFWLAGATGPKPRCAIGHSFWRSSSVILPQDARIIVSRYQVRRSCSLRSFCHRRLQLRWTFIRWHSSWRIAFADSVSCDIKLLCPFH